MRKYSTKSNSIDFKIMLTDLLFIYACEGYFCMVGR